MLFLAVFIVCAVRGYELWPFNSWRLFSYVRTGAQASWQATAVDPDGRESVINFGALPRSFHGHLAVLRGFPNLAPIERDGICRSWADAMRARGREITEIRVYRNVTAIPLGRDRQPFVVEHKLRYVCPL